MTMSFKALPDQVCIRYLEFLKLIILNWGFSTKVTIAHFYCKNYLKLSELNTYNLENDNIFPLIDQIKVSKVPLCIRQWHLWVT